MEIIPQGNRVLVERVNLNDTSLVIPKGVDIHGADYDVCRVVAKGEGRQLDDGTFIPISLSIGDEVVLHPEGVLKLEPSRMYGNRELAIASVPAIVAVIKRSVSDLVKPVPVGNN